jgi:hypothetical protein
LKFKRLCRYNRTAKQNESKVIIAVIKRRILIAEVRRCISYHGISSRIGKAGGVGVVAG